VTEAQAAAQLAHLAAIATHTGWIADALGRLYVLCALVVAYLVAGWILRFVWRSFLDPAQRF
jgi:hypothetical protein